MLRPGEIELTVRNDGPDAVDIAQVVVNDAYVPFETSGEDIGRLGSTDAHRPLPVDRGRGLRRHPADLDRRHHRARDPGRRRDAGGRRRLLRADGAARHLRRRDPGGLGMLWLPFVRRVSDRLAPGPDRVHDRPAGVPRDRRRARGARDRRRRARRRSAAPPWSSSGRWSPTWRCRASTASCAGAGERAGDGGAAAPAGAYLALLVAIGIGLHNLGEGLAIGSAYAAGALALGTFLVVGFAIHNTTEGLAIVAPLASERPGLAAARRCSA